VLAVCTAGPTLAATVFASSQWDTNAVVLLDETYTEVSRFTTGASQANGLASANGLIFSGHFLTSEVIAYNLSGVEQFRWGGTFSSLRGMTMLGGELVIYTTGSFGFYDPLTGALNNTVTYIGATSVEGIASDGTNLFAMRAGEIFEMDLTGAIVNTFAFSTSNCALSLATGLTANADGNLSAMCRNGDWFKLDKSTGAILASGSSALSDNFALTALTTSEVPVPAALPLLLTGFGALGFAARRRRRMAG
jgi:hypothetical protein